MWRPRTKSWQFQLLFFSWRGADGGPRPPGYPQAQTSLAGVHLPAARTVRVKKPNIVPSSVFTAIQTLRDFFKGWAN